MDEQASTYFVYDRLNKEELRRLTIQDRLITKAMGGVLSEQSDPSIIHAVLDVACGTGGWIIEAAKQHPEMYLTGIDISNRMIEYARGQANADQVSDRVEFQVMDALFQLQFPPDSFDLVNLRFGVSFIRNWEWTLVISEMLRVTKPGGVVRITDSGIVQESNSPALRAFQLLVAHALDRAGHLYALEESGITTHLAPLLQRCGARQLQTKTYDTRYQAGTKEGKAYVEDITHAMKTLKPFLSKWVGAKDYEQLCQRAREQMTQSDFSSLWELLTVWGVK
jgi:ubiquinone/menaquinone biosynthesis C-methylase UbiE